MFEFLQQVIREVLESLRAFTAGGRLTIEGFQGVIATHRDMGPHRLAGKLGVKGATFTKNLRVANSPSYSYEIPQECC